jgi:hypothetical protein
MNGSATVSRADDLLSAIEVVTARMMAAATVATISGNVSLAEELT